MSVRPSVGEVCGEKSFVRSFVQISEIIQNLKGSKHTDSSICLLHLLGCRRGSSVSIATCYGLDGPGIEPRWQGGFPHPSIPAPRPTQPPVQCAPGFNPRDKAAAAWRWPPTLCQCQCREWVEPYLYLFCVPALACYGVTFTFSSCNYETGEWLINIHILKNCLYITVWLLCNHTQCNA